MAAALEGAVKWGGSFKVNTSLPLAQFQPIITVLADGQFVVAWTDSRYNYFANKDTTWFASRFQVFNADGTVSGGEITLSQAPNDVPLTQWGMLGYAPPYVSPSADGGFVVTWKSFGSGFYQRTYAADGTLQGQRQGGSYPATPPSPISQPDPHTPFETAQLADGNLVAVWCRETSNGPAIMARLYNSAAVPLGAEFRLNDVHGRGPEVTALPDGTFIVTWARTTDQRPMYQLLQADGTKIGTEQTAGDSGQGPNGFYVTQRDVAVLPDGRFVIAWTNGDIQAQIFDPRHAGVELTAADVGQALIGTGYADVFHGGLGNDRLEGDAGADVITGGGGNDYIDGGGDGDLLDGGAGDDMLIGHGGDDVFVVDSLGDTVVEDAGAGLDIVRTALDQIVLAANVEGLELLGSAGLSAHGNADANWLYGNDGANWLFGEAGADMLDGGAGNDVLDGGAGGDWLRGGAGDDVYVVDAGDTVTENPGEGIDIVQTAIDGYVLPSNVEAIELQGSGDISARGGEGNNWLYGNDGANKLQGEGGDDLLDGGAGNDRLIGGAGNDVLRGGGADDTFVFAGAFGIDYIVGFEAGPERGDVIELDRSQFADLNALVAAWRDDGAGNTVITHGSDMIVIMGVTTEQLYGNDFVIV